MGNDAVFGIWRDLLDALWVESSDLHRLLLLVSLYTEF